MARSISIAALQLALAAMIDQCLYQSVRLQKLATEKDDTAAADKLAAVRNKLREAGDALDPDRML